jgi:hypothetical protein
MVCGAANRSTPRYGFVYRSVDHARLRGLCDQLRGSQPRNVALTPTGGFGKVADFARNTYNLYEQRISADYDPLQSFTVTEAKIAVSDAIQAIKWFRASTQEQQEGFLTLLLFKAR